MSDMIDIAIIGAGPAGLSAAVNSLARGKTVRIFSSNENYLAKAERVDNHLGFYNITGKELMNRFIEHVNAMNIKIEKEKVVNILPFGDYFMINANGEIIESKKVILAMGMSKVKEIPGESRLLGIGVSYCATCDGMLYRNKIAVVWDQSKDATREANFLNDIGVKVIFISKSERQLDLNSNIEFIKGSINEVIGDVKVESVVVEDKIIACDAVFMLREIVAPKALIEGLKIDDGFISVNSSMETSIEGVYAAGDCTGKPLQVSKAVSEGLIAAQDAAKKIDKIN